MKKIFALVLCLLALTAVTGQTTTSSIKGIVKSSTNELLPGASILAIHTPTGGKYSASIRLHRDVIVDLPYEIIAEK